MEEKTGKIMFQPGDLIVPQSQPFIKVLHASHKGKLCDYCFNPGSLKRCAGCLVMFYCGKTCQRRDWKDAHSIECKSEVFKDPPVGVLLEPGLLAKLLRTLAKFIRKPESFTEKHTAYNKIQKSFNDLMAHEEVISAHPATAEFLVRLFARLRSQDTAFGPVDFTEDFLTTAFGVWKTNGFEIMNLEETQSIGAGIYIPHSAINHSCRPNAVRVCKVDLMEIRCIHPVPEGQEPTISYLAGNRTREERQAVLKTRYNFGCQCDLCTDEEFGPLIDYEKLTHMETKLHYFTATSYNAATDFKEQGIELLTKLYHEYDERTTNFCSIYFDILFQWQMTPHNIPIPKPYLRRAANDLEKRLRITFGKESNDYIQFLAKLRQLAIQLPKTEHPTKTHEIEWTNSE